MFLVLIGSANDRMYSIASQTGVYSHTPVASRICASENCTKTMSELEGMSVPNSQLGGSRRSPGGEGPTRDEGGTRPANTSITCAPCDWRRDRVVNPPSA